MSDQLDDRFKCQDTEWSIPRTPPIDYLVMKISQDQVYMYLFMEKYIDRCLTMLDFQKLTAVSIPINAPVDTSSPELTSEEKTKSMTAVGCIGWLVNTCRPDIAYAHSRIAQHMASPNRSALEAVSRVFAYLKGTDDYGIRVPLHSGNDADDHWQFYCDSDFAGNCEEQNAKRSQNGFIAILNEAPVLWGSKVSSVTFAHPGIGEAHADVSSGAVEIYAAANATFEFLHMSYVADELGVAFPKPLKL